MENLASTDILLVVELSQFDNILVECLHLSATSTRNIYLLPSGDRGQGDTFRSPAGRYRSVPLASGCIGGLVSRGGRLVENNKFPSTLPEQNDTDVDKAIPVIVSPGHVGKGRLA